MSARSTATRLARLAAVTSLSVAPLVAAAAPAHAFATSSRLTLTGVHQGLVGDVLHVGGVLTSYESGVPIAGAAVTCSNSPQGMVEDRWTWTTNAQGVIVDADGAPAIITGTLGWLWTVLCSTHGGVGADGATYDGASVMTGGWELLPTVWPTFTPDELIATARVGSPFTIGLTVHHNGSGALPAGPMAGIPVVVTVHQYGPKEITATYTITTDAHGHAALTVPAATYRPWVEFHVDGIYTGDVHSVSHNSTSGESPLVTFLQGRALTGTAGTFTTSGATTALAFTLKDTTGGAGTGVAGQPLAVSASTAGGPWRALPAVTTGAAGTVTVPVTATWNTRVQVSYAGAPAAAGSQLPGLEAATAPVVTIGARPTMRLLSAPSAATRTRDWVLTGTLTPAASGVRVQLTIGSTVLATGTTTAAGAFTLRHRFTARGSATLVVRTVSDARLSAVSSRPRTITVR